ncbi:MAG TPA: bifunctional riboflavin kinase/FAD synthetase [Candidatus Binatia bacterium]|jgi:riboflavin kinase/FMN adenylyltransferase
MEIFRHIDDPKLSFERSAITLGNFDGVHLGHQALIRATVEAGKRLDCRSVVLTFEPHPLKVLAPERAPKLILSHKDKMLLFQELGIDAVVIQNFDQSFANIEAEDFVRRFLVDRLRAKETWVGSDLRFGKNRKGSADDLTRLGRELGFHVATVDPIIVNGSRVSSSRIRQLLEQGAVEEAAALLGRYHFVSGKVVSGHRRGRGLGFPTANIASRTEVVPANGIYATVLEVKGQRLPSATSVGTNPTFGAAPRTVETFIMDFDNDIYGEQVRLSFVKRIRDEKKFDSIAALTDQMDRDVAAARSILDQALAKR